MRQQQKDGAHQVFAHEGLQETYAKLLRVELGANNAGDMDIASFMSSQGLPNTGDVTYTDVIQSLTLNDLKELEREAKDSEREEHLQNRLTEHWLENFGPLKIAHVVSLMPGPGINELAVLDSMATAKYETEKKHPGVHVELIGVQMEGEKLYQIPTCFRLAKPMNDNTASRWGCKKALPFAAHMMRALQSEAPNADLYIQTNADVGVMPEFYTHVAKEYRLNGHDGLNILKVQIPATCDGKDLAHDLPKAYELVRELPQVHPGSETFVWNAKRTDEMIRGVGSMFLGYGPIGGEMIRAVEHHSRSFKTVQGEHWVFHIGAEGENGRGDPGLMGTYMKQVEAERPNCKFFKAQRAPPNNEDKSCPYNALNHRASDSLIEHRRLSDNVQKSILNATYTWQELHDMAFERSGMLPTRQQLIQAQVTVPEAEVWLPVRRIDGNTDDWVRIGSKFTEYESHLDLFSEPPSWSGSNVSAATRPKYFFLDIPVMGDLIED